MSLRPEPSASPLLAESRPHGLEADGSGLLGRARDAVEGLIQQLYENRLVARDGSSGWVGPVGYGTTASPLQVPKLGPYFYHGVPGVAFFLAAAGRVLKEPLYEEMALSALQPLRDQIARLGSDGPALPTGGLIGSGSILYGLLRIGSVLEDETLLDDAATVANWIRPELIEADRRVWVQAGCAGALLALLSLSEHRPEPSADGLSPEQRAVLCGRRLVLHRRRMIEEEDGPRAWALAPGQPPLGGFAYGAAGVVYALLRLSVIAGEETVLPAAREGLRFLDDLYDGQSGRWRDVRPLFERKFAGPQSGSWRDWWVKGGGLGLRRSESEGPGVDTRPLFEHTWCHGSPGIALGRLAGLPVLERARDRPEIEGVLHGLGADTDGPDDLCCGHAGRLDVLVTAFQKTERPEYRSDADRIASLLLDHAESPEGLRLSAARGRGIFAPMLFQGVSGVGYALLRWLDPETVPAILLME